MRDFSLYGDENSLTYEDYMDDQETRARSKHIQMFRDFESSLRFLENKLYDLDVQIAAHKTALEAELKKAAYSLGTSEEFDTIYNEFKKYGFRSKIVKDIVERIENEFIPEDVVEKHNIICRSIAFGGQRFCVIFDDKTTNKSFALSFPAVNELIYDDKDKSNGNVSLAKYIYSDDLKTYMFIDICSSLKAKPDIKNALSDLLTTDKYDDDAKLMKEKFTKAWS